MILILTYKKHNQELGSLVSRKIGIALQRIFQNLLNFGVSDTLFDSLEERTRSVAHVTYNRQRSQGFQPCGVHSVVCWQIFHRQHWSGREGKTQEAGVRGSTDL